MTYMDALFERFCGYPSVPEELEVQRKALSEQLPETQRRMLLKYADDMIDHNETTALNSFAAGFTLAAEIGREMNTWRAKAEMLPPR